jgi:hypothetical protein
MAAPRFKNKPSAGLIKSTVRAAIDTWQVVE